MRHYGIGPVTATSIVCELGDVSRLAASRKAVRCAGLDVGGHRPDQHSRLGNLTRQGSPQLRWASYEAAQTACKPRSPDCGHYRCGTGSRRSPSSRAPDPKLAPLAVSRLDERDQLGLVGGVVESVGARHHRTDVTPDTQRGATAATRQPQGAWEPLSGPWARPTSCYRPLLSAPRRSGAM